MQSSEDLQCGANPGRRSDNHSHTTPAELPNEYRRSYLKGICYDMNLSQAGLVSGRSRGKYLSSYSETIVINAICCRLGERGASSASKFRPNIPRHSMRILQSVERYILHPTVVCSSSVRTTFISPTTSNLYSSSKWKANTAFPKIPISSPTWMASPPQFPTTSAAHLFGRSRPPRTFSRPRMAPTLCLPFCPAEACRLAPQTEYYNFGGERDWEFKPRYRAAPPLPVRGLITCLSVPVLTY